MAATIYYEFSGGTSDYTAELLIGAIVIDTQVLVTDGTHTFIDVANGTYIINITDGKGCVIQKTDIIVDCVVTTTTTVAFNTKFVGNVDDIIETTAGVYMVVGTFSEYNGETAGKIISLNSGGTINYSFTGGTGFVGNVEDILETSDTKYLVTGFFSSYSGVTANKVIKLNIDGTIDPSFDISSGFTTAVHVDDAIETTGGTYLLGGDFDAYSGVSAGNIIMLTSGGTIDYSFTGGTGFNDIIDDIIQTSGGKYLVGGFFQTYSGVSANRIIQLNTDGSVDYSFTGGTGFDSDVDDILETSDGNYLVSGNFTSYSGVSANRIIKLNTDGSIDYSFTGGTGFNGTVDKLVETSDGKYIMVGEFTSYSGVSATRIIRLYSGGTVDNTFVSGTGFNLNVDDIIETSENDFMVGGSFTDYDGTSGNKIFKLDDTGGVVW